jgi:RimJ/RimL family protein N-acetyltransferase
MSLTGQYCHLEPLDAEKHAATLFNGFAGHDWLWDYMPQGPFHSAAQFHRWVKEAVQDQSFRFFAIRTAPGKPALGVCALMRMDPAAGSIELGNICIAPALQRSPAVTEAFYLLMKWSFEAGYRRFEWKCNALNMPSRRAAQRLGLSYEGIFRQALIVKGRNRDTAWFAAIDKEWPALKSAFEAWLNPSNFDAEGKQIERLSDLTALVRAASDPALSEG